MVRDGGKGIIQAVSESKHGNNLPKKSDAEKLRDRCKIKIGEMRKEVEAGLKTEDQTFKEAMYDKELREYLRATGMPIPAWAPKD